jgi:hypothetical protein
VIQFLVGLTPEQVQAVVTLVQAVTATSNLQS